MNDVEGAVDGEVDDAVDVEVGSAVDARSRVVELP